MNIKVKLIFLQDMENSSVTHVIYIYVYVGTILAHHVSSQKKAKEIIVYIVK